jgi:thioesterase domain-containing protein
VPLLVAIDGAPPAVDIGPPGLSEKTKLTYYRLTNAAATLVQLGRDVVQRVRHRSPQDAAFRDIVRSAWQASAFRPIWQRATGPIAGKLARVLGCRSTPRHAADTAADTAELPPDHRAFAAALFDAIHAYVPDRDFPGEVVVFESTAEPARSSGGVARRWARIAANLTVVAVEGSHMSIVADPDGRPLARFLCRKLHEISAQQLENLRRPAGLPNEAIAAMPTGSSDYRGGAASPAG